MMCGLQKAIISLIIVCVMLHVNLFTLFRIHSVCIYKQLKLVSYAIKTINVNIY